MLMEKENRYFILLLDRYTRQVQLIDPQEISHEEFKKEQGGLGNIEKMSEAEADRLFRKYEAETKIKKDEYDKYHKYNFKVVSIANNHFSVLWTALDIL